MKSAFQEYGVIQARLEAEISRPAVLTVTSAARHDGKTMLSTGLAHSLAASGYRVLLVDGNQQSGNASTTLLGPSKARTHSGSGILASVVPGALREPDFLAINPSDADGSLTNEAARAIFVRCREMYDYVVVDTSGALESSAGLTFAAIADTVLVAVRLGRAASQADRDLVATLNSVGANLSGDVTTRSRAITRFAKQHAAMPVRAKGGVPSREEPDLGGNVVVPVPVGVSK